MKRKKLAKTILTFGLSAAMVMGTGAMAFAADGDVNDTGGTTATNVYTATTESPVKINKKVQYAKGVTVPSQVFTFTFKQSSEDQPATAAIPDVTVTISDLAKMAANSAETSTTSEAEQTGGLDLSALTTTGTYTYTVKESAIAGNPDDQGYGWQTNDTEFTLQVSRLANGTYEYVVKDSDGNKVSTDDFLFTNIYTKRGGGGEGNAEDEDKDNTPDSLVISKVVSGDQAPEDAEFTYTINFTKSSIDKSTDTSYTATRIKANGTTYDKDVTVDATNGTFNLKAGEKLVFNNIPAGTTYTVTENASTEFTAAITAAHEDGTDVTDTTKLLSNSAKNTALTSATMLIGEGQNDITFTNSAETITVTGVVNEYGALLSVVAIATAGGALLIVRRKRENEAE